MSAIGPGALLLCVDVSGAPELTAGRIYECEARPFWRTRPCDRCAAVEVGHGVVLVECQAVSPDLPAPINRYNFCPGRFVPAGRKGDFQTLLRKANRPVKEDA